jgi:hypothetical protein
VVEGFTEFFAGFQQCGHQIIVARPIPILCMTIALTLFSSSWARYWQLPRAPRKIIDGYRFTQAQAQALLPSIHYIKRITVALSAVLCDIIRSLPCSNPITSITGINVGAGVIALVDASRQHLTARKCALEYVPGFMQCVWRMIPFGAPALSPHHYWWSVVSFVAQNGKLSFSVPLPGQCRLHGRRGAFHSEPQWSASPL